MNIRQLSSALSRRRLAINGGRPSARVSASSAPTRLIHSPVSDLHYGQSPPYSNVFGYYLHNIPKHDFARTVVVKKAPIFAIEEDVHTLFEESNIAVDRTHMIYTYLGENDTGGIPVVLKSPAQVSTAIKELNGAPLFNKRVLVEPLDLRNPKDSPFNPRDIPSNPTVRWGWYANKSAATEEIKLRYPLISYPQGIFTPFKQGRVVIFSGLPADNNIVYLAPRWLYPKLHAYNVLALSTARFYQSPSRHGEQRAYIRCVFQTADDAQEVCQVYNDTSPFGEKLHVHIARPPLKHLGASWDFGHNRAHGQPRDYGTADGTNFETMQDDVYRKWLLGKKDRGLWVPDHTY